MINPRFHLAAAITAHPREHVVMLGTETPILITRHFKEAVGDEGDADRGAVVTLPAQYVQITNNQERDIGGLLILRWPDGSIVSDRYNQRRRLNFNGRGPCWYGPSFVRPDVTVGLVLEHCPSSILTWTVDPERPSLLEMFRTMTPEMMLDPRKEQTRAYVERIRAARRARCAPTAADAIRRRDEVYELAENAAALDSIKPALNARERRYVQDRRRFRDDVSRKDDQIAGKGLRLAAIMQIIEGGPHVADEVDA